MENELVIKESEVLHIIKGAPAVYSENVSSHDNCIAALKKIISEIEENGMTPELDEKAALMVKKTRRTLQVMQERRAPITKLFDLFRSKFTELENGIDVKKKGTEINNLQNLRDEYARKLRDEHERKIIEEKKRLMLQEAQKKFRIETSYLFEKHVNEVISKDVENLTSLYYGLSLENYESTFNAIKNACTNFPESEVMEFNPVMMFPAGITQDFANETIASIRQEIAPRAREQYAFEIKTNKDGLLDMLPARKLELEKLSQLKEDEQEAERKRIEERKKIEKINAEIDKEKKEEELRRKFEMQKISAEEDSLFNSAFVSNGKNRKDKVKLKLHILSPEGILPIISYWFAKEGNNLSCEEIEKLFKKQITFCEKVVNAGGEMVRDANVQYIEDVKAV